MGCHKNDFQYTLNNYFLNSLEHFSSFFPMTYFSVSILLSKQYYIKRDRDHHGRNRMVVRFTTTYAIGAYHH